MFGGIVALNFYRTIIVDIIGWCTTRGHTCHGSSKCGLAHSGLRTSSDAIAVPHTKDPDRGGSAQKEEDEARIEMLAAEAMQRWRPELGPPPVKKESPLQIAQRNAWRIAARAGDFGEDKRKATLDQIAALGATDSASPPGAPNNSGLRLQLIRRARDELFESLIVKLGPVEDGFTRYHRYTYQVSHNVQTNIQISSLCP